MGAQPYIAVIDDDRAVRIAVGSLLRSLGLACVMFDSARRFVYYPERGWASCIITDVHMPAMSGLQLQEWMLHQAVTPPMIFITADASTRAREQAIASGAAGYLEKPFAPDVLIDCLAGLELLR